MLIEQSTDQYRFCYKPHIKHFTYLDLASLWYKEAFIMESFWIPVFVGMMWIPMYMMWRKYRAQQQPEYMNLHIPLCPESIMYRIDAARTKANEGFTVCCHCEFENFKHSIFCILCGETIEAHDISVQGKDKMETIDSTRKLLSTGGRRQRRALKRREWTRRIQTDDNKMVWFWDHDVQGNTEERGYVVLFSKAREMDITIVEPEPAGNLEEENSTNEKSTKRPIQTTLNSTNHALRHETESNLVEFVDAQEADASRFPLQVTYEGMGTTVNDEPAIFLQYFQLDFPSKLAEFIKTTSLLVVSPEDRCIKLKMNRETVVTDSLQVLGLLPSQDIRVAFRIDFLGEQGVDAGGLYREWMLLVYQGLVQQDKGIFKCINELEQTYYLNPGSVEDIGEDSLFLFYATGRLLGRSLLEGNTTGFHLALPLLKIIVGQPITFEDLEYFDTTTYTSLLWLKENSNVHQLCLDFSICEHMANGDKRIVDLIPNGRNVVVDDDNKDEYIDRWFRYLLLESIQSQLYVFLKGLYEVIPMHVFLMLDAEELDYLLCGSDEIDVDDWERNTQYSSDLQDHPAMKWFWELVHEMSNEYRHRLLQFTTGSSRVPITGFNALTSYDGRLCPFTLKGIALFKEGYLHSHACFNRLDLPFHKDRNQLKRVLYAMLDTEQYGFTTS